MKITYVEYGETHTKNYNAKRLTLGAEVEDGETHETVLDGLRTRVKEELSGRKEKARLMRKQAQSLGKFADAIERGEADLTDEEVEAARELHER